MQEKYALENNCLKLYAPFIKLKYRNKLMIFSKENLSRDKCEAG